MASNHGHDHDRTDGMDLDRVASLDAEQAILVAALRGGPCTVPDDEVRLAAVTSWQRLEGMLATTPVEPPGFSDDLAAHLADARAATDERWSRLGARLGDLVDAWSRAGIVVVLLKGAALVHGNVVTAAERPMADIDVLVDPGAAERAHALAGELGFRADANPATWEFARTWHHHLPALHDGDGVSVEIHHRLLHVSHPLHHLDDEIRRRTVAIASRDVRRLDDVATWLHLAVHFWDDRRRGTGGALLQLRDLHLVLAGVDVEELANVAEDAGAAVVVARVAAVLDEVVPSPPAGRLRRRLGAPPSDPHVTVFVERRVLGRRTALAQLLHPTEDVPYTPWRLLTRLRRQLWPSMDDLQRVLGPHAGRRAHLTSLIPVVMDALRAPGTFLDDVRLDHWAHTWDQSPIAHGRPGG